MPEQAAAGAQPCCELLELTPYAVSSSPHFTEWLHEQQVSLAFTNIDRLFLIGLKADGRLARLILVRLDAALVDRHAL